jgi:hypothetical protein
MKKRVENCCSASPLGIWLRIGRTQPCPRRSQAAQRDFRNLPDKPFAMRQRARVNAFPSTCRRSPASPRSIIACISQARMVETPTVRENSSAPRGSRHLTDQLQVLGLPIAASASPGLHDLLWSDLMRRSLQIVVALLAVFLLVRPFDCFASPQSNQKAKDCCKKGNCEPSNPDDCCKATVQGGDQLVVSRAHHHPAPVLALVIADVPSVTSQPMYMASLFVELHAPPGSPPGSRLNLPLLI